MGVRGGVHAVDRNAPSRKCWYDWSLHWLYRPSSTLTLNLNSNRRKRPLMATTSELLPVGGVCVVSWDFSHATSL